MSEGEVIEQLVELTGLLVTSTGVFFTVLSVYIGGLNFALQNESWLARAFAFAFVTLTLAMIMAAFVNAVGQRAGLIARLEEIEAHGALTAAGAAALATHRRAFEYGFGALTLHEAIVYLVWGVAGFVLLALIYLTFFYRWRPELSAPSRLS